MLTSDKSNKRARQILRAWRKRGVQFVRIYQGDNGTVKNGTCCLPTNSDIPVNDGDKIFPVPSIAELPDSESQIKKGIPVPVAESQMSAAISDFWDDSSVTSEDV